MRSGNVPASRRNSSPPGVGPSSIAIAAGGKLFRIEPGLHTLTIAPARGAPGGVPGMSLPAAFVMAPNPGGTGSVELLGTSGTGSWIGPEGGSVVLRGPPEGGHVLVTAYMLPGLPAVSLDIDLRPLDQNPAAPTDAPPSATPAAVLRTELVLHIEREGDRHFATGGWAGRIGSRLRVEALAVRPLGAIRPGEIEYKVYAADGRETPWVTQGKLCGTRGQSLPLTGFAVRLAPRLSEEFDVVYRGAFFASGPVPAVRNGEPCFAPLPGDPLEAVEVRIVARGTA
jgi:hypothetical protein